MSEKEMPPGVLEIIEMQNSLRKPATEQAEPSELEYREWAMEICNYDGFGLTRDRAVQVLKRLRQEWLDALAADNERLRRDLLDPEPCEHSWIANSGRGGEPEFRSDRTMSDKPLMHVLCAKCNDRTWLTREQWEELPDMPAPAYSCVAELEETFDYPEPMNAEDARNWQADHYIAMRHLAIALDRQLAAALEACKEKEQDALAMFRELVSERDARKAAEAELAKVREELDALKRRFVGKKGGEWISDKEYWETPEGK